MDMFQRLFLLFTAAVALVLAGCKGTEPGPQTQDFDRAPMLANYADNLIIPAYTVLEENASSYLDLVEAFTANPTLIQLKTLQNGWLPLAEAWQVAQPYNFGPAETSFGTLVENIGTWPVDTALVLTYIAAQDTTLANFDRDTRGIPTLEYLTFGMGGDQAIVDYFNGPEGEWAKGYLRSVARDVLSNVSEVVEAWENGYRDSFVSDLGTSAGSSTSQLYNAFVQSYERLKNFKVAVPLGLRAGQTQAEPALVEAYFSTHSIPLIQLHFDALVIIWNGNNGIGFREYLEGVTGGPELISSTLEQIQNVENALAPLDNGVPFSDQIATNPTQGEALSVEMQKMVRFFKSDMSSLLGISITFDSGDGD